MHVTDLITGTRSAGPARPEPAGGRGERDGEADFESVLEGGDRVGRRKADGAPAPRPEGEQRLPDAPEGEPAAAGVPAVGPGAAVALPPPDPVPVLEGAVVPQAPAEGVAVDQGVVPLAAAAPAAAGPAVAQTEAGTAVAGPVPALEAGRAAPDAAAGPATRSQEVPERAAAAPAAAAPALAGDTGPVPARPVVQPEVVAGVVAAAASGEPAEAPAGGRPAASAGPQAAPVPGAVTAAADPRGAMPLAAPEVGMVAHEAARPAWRLAPKAAGAVRGEPVAPQALAGQITLAIGRASDHRVEIRLDPPELGRVQIQLNPGDAGLQAVVLAERPETQDLLRRHAEALARELNAAGYTNVSLDFAAGGEAAPRRDESETGGPAPAAAVEVALAPARAPADGLDIRL
jgi:hypothetical protein